MKNLTSLRKDLRHPRRRQGYLLVIVCGLAVGWLSAAEPVTYPNASAVFESAPRSPWRFTTGAQWRTLGDASFHNRPQAPQLKLPFPGSHTARRLGAGGYSDGYVNDDATGSSTTTWNFGFNSAAQSQGDSVVLHGSNLSVVHESINLELDPDGADAVAGFGGFVELESPELLAWHDLNLSAVLGYSLTRANAARGATVGVTTQRTTISGGSYTDRYAALGVLPDTPYSGTFGGPGPVISLTPSRTYDRCDGGTQVLETRYESSVQNRLNVDLHTVSLGPRISGQPKWRIGTLPSRFSASFGLALNIADWEARTEETLTMIGVREVAKWKSKHQGTDLLPGFFLEVSAELSITSHLSLYTAGRYDWSRELRGSTALSEHSLDLSGGTAMLGVLWKF